MKKCMFWSKNMFLTCFETFTLLFLSMRIDNNFLITISGVHTYCSLCILSQKCEFSEFLVKMPIFTLREVCN